MDVIELDASTPEDIRAGTHAVDVAASAVPGWPEPAEPRSLLDGCLAHPGRPGGPARSRLFAGVHDGTVEAFAKVDPHRLGTALKAANLLQARQLWPDAERVTTWNAETNEHMLAINRELGFTVTARWAMAEPAL